MNIVKDAHIQYYVLRLRILCIAIPNKNVTHFILSVCLNTISASKSLGGISLRAMLGQITLIIPTKGTLEINKCMYNEALWCKTLGALQ